MRTRFIDFEGVHGSGKTACAWNLYNNLNKHGVGAEVYFEYDLDNEHVNPCNLSFYAVFKENELDYIIKKFINYKEQIISSINKYGE